ncbi:D-alanyl-D-alanine carboxypeptidase/D-alanyl-D-alanine endopeptidase [Sporosarcina highlanderae]|uniref:D-alanyl-D-alanine carboxypeptidase/D-alanyl-D-alanine-endopeptidase n=1 Tax=Sporosarcina highlanderae TaxID=3035916 RepID=A0ABT8JMY0_9BACL|nr:D-alanyl-D-alanine carboxypeptidase/D-alanyl-D-alanine-endopeptidase [Sporosarcina highlanderae]MDN4606435.1 D-alanyl-D-alanine carboxypeptidase/D-alanyl-D-alanine-endopeptidase [Sporosarcina highlanderae]
MKKNYILKRSYLALAVAFIALFPVTHKIPNQPIAASTEMIYVASIEKTTIDEDLSQKINAILQDPKLQGAITGVSIRKAVDGEILYSHFSDIRLRPASNMKLLTGAAALDILGPDYQFSTEVLTDGQVKGVVLHGNLYLKGKGDPTLMKMDLDQFAKELKAKGITNINGSLIADDSWYDDIRYSQDLNWSDEHSYVGAQVSALTLSPNEDYDAGTVIIEVHPNTKIGSPPKVTLNPNNSHVEIVNKATTVSKGQAKSISIEREHGTNRIFIEGNMPLGGTMSRSWAAVWEPTMYALDVFQKSLEAEGIQYVGGMKTGVTPENATILASKKSMPLEELFIPFMKLSNNGHGETLVKEMGKVQSGEGSWNAGLSVMKEKLKEFGVNTDSVMLRDGSGMSHKNLISADELSTMLYNIQAKSWFPAFETSLPIAGIPERMIGGTLRNRMGEGMTAVNVKAKTGTITGVSTLSGYVTAKDGTELIFSILINNYISGPVSPIEDAIVSALAEYEF